MATGIMDFFRAAQPKPQGQQPNQQPNNQGTQGNQNQQQNQQTTNTGNGGNVQGPGTMPNQNGNNQNAGVQQPATGIDRFSKMWDDTGSQSDTPPAFNIDSKILGEVASSQDFMQGIDPELMQKATSGDVQSLMQLMNHVGRNAYSRSLEHTSTLTDKFVGAREAHNAKSMSGNVRKELTTNALSSIPNFKHPVVQKQLKETADRLQKMHPDASPQEIVSMTTEYFQELMGAMNPDSANNKDGKTKANAEVRGEDYWDEFFDAAAKEDN